MGTRPVRSTPRRPTQTCFWRHKTCRIATTPSAYLALTLNRTISRRTLDRRPTIGFRRYTDKLSNHPRRPHLSCSLYCHSSNWKIRDSHPQEIKTRRHNKTIGLHCISHPRERCRQVQWSIAAAPSEAIVIMAPDPPLWASRRLCWRSKGCTQAVEEEMARTTMLIILSTTITSRTPIISPTRTTCLCKTISVMVTTTLIHVFQRLARAPTAVPTIALAFLVQAIRLASPKMGHQDWEAATWPQKLNKLPSIQISITIIMWCHNLACRHWSRTSTTPTLTVKAGNSTSTISNSDNRTTVTITITTTKVILWADTSPITDARTMRIATSDMAAQMTWAIITNN